MANALAFPTVGAVLELRESGPEADPSTEVVAVGPLEEHGFNGVTEWLLEQPGGPEG